MFANMARREDVCTSLIYAWRGAAQREERAVTVDFSPVIIAAARAISKATRRHQYLFSLSLRSPSL